jgi:hypothetical protein
MTAKTRTLVSPQKVSALSTAGQGDSMRFVGSKLEKSSAGTRVWLFIEDKVVSEIANGLRLRDNIELPCVCRSRVKIFL